MRREVSCWFVLFAEGRWLFTSSSSSSWKFIGDVERSVDFGLSLLSQYSFLTRIFIFPRFGSDFWIRLLGSIQVGSLAFKRLAKVLVVRHSVVPSGFITLTKPLVLFSFINTLLFASDTAWRRSFFDGSFSRGFRSLTWIRLAMEGFDDSLSSSSDSWRVGILSMRDWSVRCLFAGPSWPPRRRPLLKTRFVDASVSNLRPLDRTRCVPLFVDMIVSEKENEHGDRIIY